MSSGSVSKVWVKLGLVGSLLVIIGVFLDWMVVDYWVVEGRFTGWEIATLGAISEPYPYIVLIGGGVGLVGSYGGLINVKEIGYLLPIGGLIALIGIIWALIDISNIGQAQIVYGLYLCLVGSILTILSANEIVKLKK
ncbi:hypothetical protein [Methanonatronarchaeum sp. AMET-Sl]|uniref:hypothetical protein n=1 Tax=Methanonatronarchaeum sp. AMET-Sl TaxID=3037654 RepID=UPI00244E1A29|nr:hypothetical protein [Methanonatronarchaeum sp. AMET-Sl]WGI17937.1 hypothetical protein QEN48_02725 [Methanonatronarchaeum sp. AMET-Sl]